MRKFFNSNHSHNHCFISLHDYGHSHIIVAFASIVVIETKVIAIFTQKSACLQITLKKLIVMFKVHNKYTKNNIN